jgi:hypothetical protein
LLSPKGELTTLDASNLVVQHTQDIPESRDLLEAFVFAAKSCSFMSSYSVTTVAVIFYSFQSKINVMLMGVGEEGGVVKLGGGNTDVPVSVSSPFLSFLTFSSSRRTLSKYPAVPQVT